MSTTSDFKCLLRTCGVGDSLYSKFSSASHEALAQYIGERGLTCASMEDPTVKDQWCAYLSDTLLEELAQVGQYLCHLDTDLHRRPSLSRADRKLVHEVLQVLQVDYRGWSDQQKCQRIKQIYTRTLASHKKDPKPIRRNLLQALMVGLSLLLPQAQANLVSSDLVTSTACPFTFHARQEMVGAGVHGQMFETCNLQGNCNLVAKVLPKLAEYETEIKMHQLMNQMGIGPTLIDHYVCSNQGVMIMDKWTMSYLEWLKSDRVNTEETNLILAKQREQRARLNEIGLDYVDIQPRNVLLKLDPIDHQVIDVTLSDFTHVIELKCPATFHSRQGMLGAGVNGQVFETCDVQGHCNLVAKILPNVAEYETEVKMHQLMNQMGIGPTLVDHYICGSKGVMIMDKWTTTYGKWMHGRVSREEMEFIFAKRHEQRERLYEAGLEHRDEHLSNLLLKLDPIDNHVIDATLSDFTYVRAFDKFDRRL